MIAALLIYSLGVLAFAGDLAFGRPRRAAEARAKVPERVAELAAVGAAAGTPPSGEADAPADGDAGGPDGPPAAVLPARRLPFLRAVREAGTWVRAAVALSTAGVLAHLVAVVTRGFAVHRAPWGNMYEFVTALTCVAAIFFVYVLVRYRAWALGVWVMGAVVLALGLAETVIYTSAGPLVPALQSYWLSIHVTAMTLATGIFFVAAVLGILYLVIERYQARVAAGKAVSGGNGLLDRIPATGQLDKMTYRAVVFGFPVWTFGVIAGAIWADQAWGRYWGWDPVETWAFITWILYASYLHARATAGFRRWAHYIQLLGFASLVVNILVIQVFVTGMHSYAGVPG
ncbi:MAG: c-type cytochrome biogenesis protein CcsB [Nocardiopsaceae bacterium]|nr:c-type cytochrome biogenesis protein CcsB [Nocardiopsaceae bacterium]